MNELSLEQHPSKLVPVLLGGLAMTATGTIPVLSLVNCACCAGIMGGAILGVWMYKKSFPSSMPFTVGTGALIGTLSGLVGSILTTIISTFVFGLFSSNFGANFDAQIEEIFNNPGMSVQNPAQVEQIREIITGLVSSPALLFLFILVASAFVFTGFGALGGVIGGNIFKTKYIEVQATQTDDYSS